MEDEEIVDFERAKQATVAGFGALFVRRAAWMEMDMSDERRE